MTKPTDRDMERLFARLDAKERATLYLASWREDREPDPLLRRTTPDYQVASVNSYLLDAERANSTLGAIILWLGQRAETIAVRLGLVAALRLHGMLEEQIVMALQLDLPEPVTESERDRRLTEQRSELIPIGEAAWLLSDHDLDDDELDAEQSRHEKRVRDAVKRGALKVEKGLVRYGELMDWAGRAMFVIPEWGCEVAVLSDIDEDYAGKVNRFRERLLAGATRRANVPGEGQPGVDQIAEALNALVAAEVAECWGIVLAIDEAIVVFEGDFAPSIHSSTLLELESVRARLGLLADQAEGSGIRVVLPGNPDAEFAELLKARFQS